jgi:N-acetylated-alpha-linked acidic dipeptidase
MPTALRRAAFSAAIVLAGIQAVSAGAPAARDEAETLLRSVPSAESFSRHLRVLTEEPHQTGTPRNMELADYVRERFVEYGLEDVHFHDTPALMSYGRSAGVEIVTPLKLELKLSEDPVDGDKDSHLYADPAQVAFHAYAPGGDVTAEVVYANGGSPEDFAALEKLGVDVRGRIVVMRYSNPYSYRGHKLYQAESRGAVGAIIYSDPAEDGYARGEVYPDGPWGPKSHVQWGAILYDWFGPGEPFTFHWQKAPDGTWREGRTRDKQLPKIPSLPMSHEAAVEILSRLRGPVGPAGFQGALPFTYRTGPGPVRVRLRTDNVEQIGTMRNVIGTIRGAVEPDKWVVLGNHRDAWIYGAVDPSSGTAALLETARALGTAARRGFRPRRSIVFANWDAEEQLLGGSTQWVKDNREKLLKDGVVYVNVDSGATGPSFEGGATLALADVLEDVLRDEPDPGSGGSLFDAWQARAPGGVAEVKRIVGATDYTAFMENLGMSCIDMAFEGPYGVYHSQYDNYQWLSRVADPGFHYNLALSRVWSVLALRLANAEVLPMRYSRYARAVPSYLESVEAKLPADRRRRFDAARAAAGRWQEAALSFERALEGRGKALPPEALGEVNAGLLQVERAMTEPRGLLGRPFFKHLLYAPQPTYREELVPRVFEAIEAGRFDALDGHEAELVAAFDRAAALLTKAESRLAP